MMIERMGNVMAKVTFDYSKANLFIREHEMESMKDIVLAAKDKLLEIGRAHV